MTARLRRVRLRRVGPVVALLALVLGVSGCGVSLQSLPSPADTTGATYEIDVQFADVQNLSEGAPVKIGGIQIGQVESIQTHGYHAEVLMSMERKFPLGTDVAMQVRFTTPLGEDFVSVRSRGDYRGHELHNGATVPLRDTGTAPSIEDTFAAFSTLLNGGGFANLQTIASQLDLALRGHTGNVRDVLVQLHTIIANLDAHKADIDRTLENFAVVAKQLNDATPTIVSALDTFPATLSELAGDTGRIRTLLGKVGTLGDTVEGLLARSQGALLTDLDNLRPTVAALRARQDQLAPTFKALIKLGDSLRNAVPGDYVNASSRINFLLNAKPARPTPGGVRHSGETSSSAAVRELLTGGLR